jgi:preprotein translocase subunit SecE
MADVEKATETEVSEKETKVKDEKKKSPKSNKPGFGEKVKKFFKDYKSELKKIVWFGKKQTIKSTGVVIVALVIVSAVVSLLDIGLNALIMEIGKLI